MVPLHKIKNSWAPSSTSASVFSVSFFLFLVVLITGLLRISLLFFNGKFTSSLLLVPLFLVVFCQWTLLA